MEPLNRNGGKGIPGSGEAQEPAQTRQERVSPRSLKEQCAGYSKLAAEGAEKTCQDLKEQLRLIDSVLLPFISNASVSEEDRECLLVRLGELRSVSVGKLKASQAVLAMYQGNQSIVLDRGDVALLGPEGAERFHGLMYNLVARVRTCRIPENERAHVLEILSEVRRKGFALSYPFR